MEQALQLIKDMKSNEELVCILHDLKTDTRIDAVFDLDKEEMERHIKNMEKTDFKFCWLQEKTII